MNTIEDSNWMRETILDGQHMLQMKSVNAKIKVAQNLEKIEDKLTEHNGKQHQFYSTELMLS